eukprot:403113-Rhodomonas_salina.1
MVLRPQLKPVMIKREPRYAVSLRACYAMSGTEIQYVYGANTTRLLRDVRFSLATHQLSSHIHTIPGAVLAHTYRPTLIPSAFPQSPVLTSPPFLYQRFQRRGGRGRGRKDGAQGWVGGYDRWSCKARGQSHP